MTRPWIALAVIAFCAVDAGCVLDRAVRAADRDGASLDASRDAEPMDAAPELDALVPDGGPVDAADLDAGPPDGGPPDTGPPDTGPPDTGPASCDSQYGAATGYIACAERATECEFATTLESVRSCGTTCAALGGHCIDAYRNELPFPPCERQGEPMGCDVVHVDDICICSRGP